MNYRWSIAPANLDLATTLARQLGISPLLAQCLLNRGVCEPEAIARFIEPRLKNMADPFLLPDMELAVVRLLRARERGEQVVVFGDYDVDGVTSTALLLEVMRALGWRVESYLPHRMDEGYGLTRAAVEKCVERFQPAVLLAVDCGSKAGGADAWLQERNIDLIVVDHHQPSEPPPKLVAFVNPHANARLDFRELCSVGLAFKLAHALVKRLRETNCSAALELDLRPWLELVALGTVADLVPLTGENRIFVAAGLARLNQTARPGLLALKRVANINQPMGGYELGFQIGPRLNAAGRLETALNALHLLLSRDPAEAKTLAERLDAQNRERQEIERKIVDEVLARVRANFDPARDFAIVEGDSSWHIGVVGIVASRVVQTFYRPTIIFGGDGVHWRGSGRSIAGFDLAQGLAKCSDILVRHGGHAMAAGLSVEPNLIAELRSRLNGLVRQALTDEQLRPELRLDGKVEISQLDWKLLKELERVQQTGMGNPPVQLLLCNQCLMRPSQNVGADKKHLKMWIGDGTATREAIWWGGAERKAPDGRFDLAFTPQLAEFNGTYAVQLKVIDWRPAQPI